MDFSFKGLQTRNEVMEDNTGLLVGGVIGLVIGGVCYYAYRDATKFYRRIQVSKTNHFVLLQQLECCKTIPNKIIILNIHCRVK